MSIVDENGQPVAYGWNEIAAAERWEKDRHRLRLISDEEFARRFPHIVYGKDAANQKAQAAR